MHADTSTCVSVAAVILLCLADIDSMTDATFCNSCVCGLGTAIVLSFDKAGTKVNGQPVSALAASGDIATLSNLLSNCSAVMGIELLQAGALTAQALGQLSTCDVNQSSLDCASAAAPGTAPGVMSTTNGSAGPATAAPGSVSALERGQQQHTAKSAVSAAAAHAPAMPMVALATAVLLAAVVLM